MHKQVKAFYHMAFEYHIAAVTLWTQIVSAPYLYVPISYFITSYHKTSVERAYRLRVEKR